MRSLLVVLGFTLVGCVAPAASELDPGYAGDGDGDGDGDFVEPDGSGGMGVAESGGSSSGGSEEQPSGGVPSSGGALGTGGFESSGGAPSSGGVTSSGGALVTSSGGAPVVDSDSDGVPDALDLCEGGDDDQDLNENGEIDECEPGWCRSSPNPGSFSCASGAHSQFYCLEEFTVLDGFDHEAGECIQCPDYTYNCNGLAWDLCETYSERANPCPVP